MQREGDVPGNSRSEKGMTRRVDPQDQFSKKLARWSAWFWFGYMVLGLAAVVVQPLAGEPGVYLAGFSTAVMILNIGAYTRNSIYDKAIAAGVKAVGKFRFGKKREEDEEEYEEETGD